MRQITSCLKEDLMVEAGRAVFESKDLSNLIVFLKKEKELVIFDKDRTVQSSKPIVGEVSCRVTCKF